MRKTEGSAQNLHEMPDCPVCQLPLSKNLSATKCGHVYHRDCIGTYLSKYGEKCPLCNQAARPADIRPLIFETTEDKNSHRKSHSVGKELQYCLENKKLIKQNQKLTKKVYNTQQQLKDYKKLKNSQSLRVNKQLTNLRTQHQNFHKLLDQMGREHENEIKKALKQKDLIIQQLRQNITGQRWGSSMEFAQIKEQLDHERISDRERVKYYQQLLQIKYLTQYKMKQKIKQLQGQIINKDEQIKKYSNTINMLRLSNSQSQAHTQRLNRMLSSQPLQQNPFISRSYDGPGWYYHSQDKNQQSSRDNKKNQKKKPYP